MPNEVGYITVKEMKEFIEQFPDEWIFTVDNTVDYRSITRISVLDEGEIGISIE